MLRYLTVLLLNVNIVYINIKSFKICPCFDSRFSSPLSHSPTPFFSVCIFFVRVLHELLSWHEVSFQWTNTSIPSITEHRFLPMETPSSLPEVNTRCPSCPSTWSSKKAVRFKGGESRIHEPSMLLLILRTKQKKEQRQDKTRQKYSCWKTNPSAPLIDLLPVSHHTWPGGSGATCHQKALGGSGGMKGRELLTHIVHTIARAPLIIYSELSAFLLLLLLLLVLFEKGGK